MSRSVLFLCAICARVSLAGLGSGDFEPVPTHTSVIRYPSARNHPNVDPASPLTTTAFALPEHLLRKSISNLGDSARLQKFVQALQTGGEVRVTILGGSIAQGCCIPEAETQQASRPETFANYPSHPATFANRFFQWLQSVFPQPQYRLHNKAYSGMVTAYVNSCLEEFIDKSEQPIAELFILEFSLNEYSLATHHNRSTYRADYEVLLRSLLSMPSKPAVFMLHCWSPLIQFHESLERHLEELAKYYAIPSFSWRLVEHHMNHTGQSFAGLYNPDQVHPTRSGHRYIFDMLAAAVRDEAFNLQTGDIAHLVPGDLPVALLGDGMIATRSFCAVREKFLQLVVHSQDWTWTNEPSKGGLARWGFVSSSVGSQLTAKLPTRGSVDASLLQDLTGSLAVGNLKSYVDMGKFIVLCSGGCTCPELEHDSHWDRHVSVITWDYVPVFIVDYDTCFVTVRVSPTSTSGGHKIKLDSLLYSDVHRQA